MECGISTKSLNPFQIDQLLNVFLKVVNQPPKCYMIKNFVYITGTSKILYYKRNKVLKAFKLKLPEIDLFLKVYFQKQ